MILASACAVTALQHAHAGYNFFTGEYTVGREEMAWRIAQRFPVELRYAGIFEVLLTQPRLDLDAAANRLRITVDVLVRNPLLLPEPVRGVLALSTGLRFDAATRSLRLDRPDADRLQLQGMGGRDAQQLQALGSVAAQQVLADYPLYTFRPEELRFGSRPIRVGAITVLPDGLVVQVQPG